MNNYLQKRALSLFLVGYHQDTSHLEICSHLPSHKTTAMQVFSLGTKRYKHQIYTNGEEVMSDKQMKGQTNYGNLSSPSPRMFFFGFFFFLKIMHYACSDSSVVISERESHQEVRGTVTSAQSLNTRVSQRKGHRPSHRNR